VFVAGLLVKFRAKFSVLRVSVLVNGDVSLRTYRYPTFNCAAPVPEQVVLDLVVVSRGCRQEGGLR